MVYFGTDFTAPSTMHVHCEGVSDVVTLRMCLRGTCGAISSARMAGQP